MQNTIHGLIKKRGEIAGLHKVALKAADALKADLEYPSGELHRNVLHRGDQSRRSFTMQQKQGPDDWVAGLCCH